MTKQQHETRHAGSFGEVQHDGHTQKSKPTICMATDFDTILLDNLLTTVTAEHVLPRTALEMHPELRGTVWHRVGFRTATTILARALLGADEGVTSMANWISRMLVASGDVTVLDAKVLVLGEGAAVVFGDRSMYVMRRNDD